MSYIIQNFIRPHYSTRMTHRVQTSTLVRNYALIYLLSFSTAQSFNINANSWRNWQWCLKLHADAFRAFPKAALPKTKLLKYTPIGVNYPKTAYYRTLVNIDQMLDGEHEGSQTLLLTPYYYQNPYFVKTTLAITFISNRTFTYQLYKFLRLVMDLWFYWPRKFKISTNFTWLTIPWYQFRFLNRYYFKIYAV
jgi:hypothetical protein